MKFTQIRNKVKMLLTELNMLILQFVVLIFLFTIFTVLHIYKMFFFKHYNLLTKSQKTLDYLLWITLDHSGSSGYRIRDSWREFTDGDHLLAGKWTKRGGS